MATLNVQDNEGEIKYVFADPNGDEFKNDERTVLQIINQIGATPGLTVLGKRRCNYGELHDKNMVVPAFASPMVTGTFDRYFFGEIVNVEYTDATGLLVAAVRIL